MKKGEIFESLSKYGSEGVISLQDATPIDTGITSSSWGYKVVQERGKHSIIFYNTYMIGNAPMAILIQYGHGTGTGGYVEGRDYINPVIIPLFDEIADDVWKAVIA